jgi:hypothetical protein
MPKILRENKQKLECIRKAVVNAQEHMCAGDPKRMCSQYIRYALDQVRDDYFHVSKKAEEPNKNDETLNDHVIPHVIILEKLLALNPVSIEGITEIIERYYMICTITRDENKMLNDAGLKSKMPEGWEDGGAIRRFARYEHVGIEISEKPTPS